MKQTHILNIGYPKCATTWLWNTIQQQKWFDQQNVVKENRELIYHGDIEQYHTTYEQFDISANFSPNMFSIDKYLIYKLSQNPKIQVSIILRNLFDLNFSLYNFLQEEEKISEINYLEYVDNLFQQGLWWKSPSTIIQRWMTFFDSTRFKFFFYDHIKSDSKKFLDNYCDQMNLPYCDNLLIYPADNITSYKISPVKMHDYQIKLINDETEKLENLLKTDLTHWKYYDSRC